VTATREIFLLSHFCVRYSLTEQVHYVPVYDEQTRNGQPVFDPLQGYKLLAYPQSPAGSPILEVPGALSPSKLDGACYTKTQLNLVPRSIIRGLQGVVLRQRDNNVFTIVSHIIVIRLRTVSLLRRKM